MSPATLIWIAAHARAGSQMYEEILDSGVPHGSADLYAECAHDRPVAIGGGAWTYQEGSHLTWMWVGAGGVRARWLRAPDAPTSDAWAKLTAVCVTEELAEQCVESVIV